MQVLNITNPAVTSVNVVTNKANVIVRKEATQKIIMFVAILVCIVAAVNL